MLHIPADGLPWKMGLLGYGWLIRRSEVEIVHGFGIFARVGMAGSNAAEYLALIEGLEALLDLRIGHEPVEVRGDAKCVIDQMTGQAGVSSPLTRRLHRRARKLSGRLHAVRWVWVPRCENRHADRLSRRSLRYLHFSRDLEREIRQARFPPPHHGGLVPLLDLRVHAPAA